MAESKTQSTTAVIAVVLSALSLASADTWRLDKSNGWKPVPEDKRSRYLTAVGRIQELVNAGKAKAAGKAFDELKTDFPGVAGPDLDLFAKAEIRFCKGSYLRATKNYDKLLTDYPRSELREAALDRQFTIGQAYLGGRRKMLLRIIPLKGYEDGVEIMEKISDRAGLDDPNGIGLKAALTVAEHYQQRKQYEEAHLKWSEISSHYQTGPMGKQALLRMAHCKHAEYNKKPEHKRLLYDASSLISAKSYYERFQLLYPSEARELNVNEILQEIDEQIAYKQLAVGKYYRRTGKGRAANLYFDMVLQNWPDTKAAGTAKTLLSPNHIESRVRQ